MSSRRDQRSAAAERYRKLYKDPRWTGPAGRRAEQLRREPNCAACAALGIVKRGWIVDHVVPHRGDPVRFWNGKLQTLCKPHHDGWKQRLERSGQPGAADVHGLPLDPGHPWNEQATPSANKPPPRNRPRMGRSEGGKSDGPA